MEGRFETKRIIGVLLMAVGVLLLLQYYHLLKEDLFLFYLSGGFLLGYYFFGGTKHYGNIGALIPGCVLLSIAIFAELEQHYALGERWGGLFFIFLGMAFWAVYLHTRTFHNEDRASRIWPAVTGISIWAFGGAVLLVELSEIRLNERQFDLITAVVLVGLGLFFFIKGNRKQRSVKLENNGQKGD